MVEEAKMGPPLRFQGFSDAWEQRKLGDLMTITSVKRIHQSDWTSSGVRFLRARDIVSAAKYEEPTDYLYISKEKYNEYSLISGKVTIGDLLVTGVGSIGVPLLITNGEPVYFKDGNVIWFKNNNVIDGNFFYYSFIHHKIQKFIKDVAGIGTVGTYTIDSGKKTPISLPIKKEQEKIGNLFKQLDDTIALHQRKLTLLKQLKQTYLQALFPQSEMNIPTLRFAGFYDPWEQRNVSSLAKETYGGGTPRTGVKKYWKGSSPWIQSSDLSINQLHNVQPTKFITEEAIKQSATHNVPDNSIAIVTRVGVGKLALMPYSYSEYCKCIEPPVRRNEPLNARNRASYCEQESRPTIFIYRTNLLYNEVACLRA